ncbi:hypothetical protein BU24DRAFT_54632 [Aaosphaeria arxii CBS 175.79]|uniref:Rhodopsin domain-containing protein n=1 Tax=Aaosphaeria arxii CBS 175.79 TaxID=1450172 RepID=A0A6A5XFM3_9PLEO|nr:uncharacterized protein BU24DRAFT_54632 [Aaosphaeria arxii CBS 175.79]KAF2011174.1 hypothetical protein BU24DRAFT_54632 [Aaosphaeria arxii CBS 175.79]
MTTVAPPNGAVAEPRNDFLIQSELIVVSVVFLCLSFVAICGRIWSQVRYTPKLKAEDYSLVISFVIFAAFNGVLFAGSKAGLGEHAWDVESTAIERVRLLSNVLDIIYSLMMLAAKGSVLFCLLSIFLAATGAESVRWSIWALLAFNGLSYTAITFVHIVACNPRSKIFDPSIQGNCLSHDGLNTAFAAINLTTSVAIFALAMVLLRQLHYTLSRKLAICGIFFVGLLACVTAAGRLFSITGYDYRRGDFTMASFHVYITAIVEYGFLVLIACLPVLTRHTSLLGDSQRPRDSWPRATNLRWVSPIIPIEEKYRSSSYTQLNRPRTTSSIGSKSLVLTPLQTSTLPPPPPPPPKPTRYTKSKAATKPHPPRPQRPSTPLSSYPETQPSGPFSNRISHQSYDSYMTASIAGMLNGEAAPSVAAPLGLSPAFSERTEYFTMPSPLVEEARQLTFTPVVNSAALDKQQGEATMFAEITRTADGPASRERVRSEGEEQGVWFKKMDWV